MGNKDIVSLSIGHNQYSNPRIIGQLDNILYRKGKLGTI